MSTLVHLDQMRPAAPPNWHLWAVCLIPEPYVLVPTGSWMTRNRSLRGVNLQTPKNQSWTSGRVMDCRRTRFNCTHAKSYGSKVDHLRIVS